MVSLTTPIDSEGTVTQTAWIEEWCYMRIVINISEYVSRGYSSFPLFNERKQKPVTTPWDSHDS